MLLGLTLTRVHTLTYLYVDLVAYKVERSRWYTYSAAIATRLWDLFGKVLPWPGTHLTIVHHKTKQNKRWGTGVHPLQWKLLLGKLG